MSAINKKPKQRTKPVSKKRARNSPASSIKKPKVQKKVVLNYSSPLNPLRKAHRIKVSNAGFNHNHDFLLRLPIGYNDFTKTVTGERSFPSKGKHVLRAVLKTKPKSVKTEIPCPLRPGKSIKHEALVRVGNFDVYVRDSRSISSNPLSKLQAGEGAYIFGEVIRHDGHFFLYQPYVLEQEEVGRLIPIYKGIHGVFKPKEMAAIIRKMLSTKPDHIQAAIDHIVIEMGAEGIPEKAVRDALFDVHVPQAQKQANDGFRVLDDVNIRTVISKASEIDRTNDESVIEATQEILDSVISAVPFTLSDSQYDVINQIRQGFSDNKPLDYLLSGDVGSGKSVVEFMAAALGYMAGKQVAIMAPNEILSTQLYKNMKSMFPEIKCLYSGSGQIIDVEHIEGKPVLIGTTAIIHAKKRLAIDIDVMIIDEQQKAGVKQKSDLLSPHTNIIEATATCIPRSMANVLFSGKIVGRIYGHADKDITTKIATFDNREWMLNQVKNALKAKGRAAIVYPKIDSKDESESSRMALKEVEGYWERHFPDRYIALHGQLDSNQKTDAMDQVLNGNKDILVTTSILEIGIDIPDLKIMIVVGANNFGASQLHQLRGRLVRNGGHGLCVFYVPGPITESSRQRLINVRDNNDGFKIAELDLELRGAGDIWDGTRQSGETNGVFIGHPIKVEDISRHFAAAGIS